MRPRKLTATATAAVALAAVGGGVAVAAWTQSGTGSGATKAADLAAPGTPAVVGTPTSSTITLSWTGSLTPAGTAASYLVQRAPFGSASWVSACAATHTTPSTVTTCTDSGLTAATDYQYRVLAALHAWRTESATSAKITTASAQLVTVPSTPDLTTDTGSSSTDNITSANRPTFTGTGTVGNTVTVLDGTTAIGSALVGADGTWTVTGPASPAVLGDGVHSITARATLATTTSVASGALSVRVDTTAPSAPSFTLANNKDFGTAASGSGGSAILAWPGAIAGARGTDAGSGPAHVLLSVSYDTGSGGSRVTRYYDPAGVGAAAWTTTSTTFSAGTTWSYSWASTLFPVANTQYEVLAQQVDVAGNSSTAAVLKVNWKS